MGEGAKAPSSATIEPSESLRPQARDAGSKTDVSVLDRVGRLKRQATTYAAGEILVLTSKGNSPLEPSPVARRHVER